MIQLCYVFATRLNHSDLVFIKMIRHRRVVQPINDGNEATDAWRRLLGDGCLVAGAEMFLILSFLCHLLKDFAK